MGHENSFKNILAWFGSTKVGAWTIINIGTRVDRWLIRLSNGNFNSTLAWPCLLLTTKGAKTGLKRTVALVYIKEGDNLCLIASKGGSPQHPSWYLNLMSNPEASVFINGKKALYRASEVRGEDYDRLWKKALEIYTGYAKYQKRAGDRRIPIVLLMPTD